MALVRWDPFQELASLQNTVNRLFGERTVWRDGEWAGQACGFPVDVWQEKDAVMVKAELPGFKQDDINVDLMGDELVIRAERHAEKEEKGKNYLRRESREGTFYRALSLGMPVKADAVSASYKDGHLTIRLPKSEEALPKRIEIQ